MRARALFALCFAMGAILAGRAEAASCASELPRRTLPGNGAADVPTNTKLWSWESPAGELWDDAGQVVFHWRHAPRDQPIDPGVLEPHRSYAVVEPGGRVLSRFTTGAGRDDTPPEPPVMTVLYRAAPARDGCNTEGSLTRARLETGDIAVRWTAAHGAMRAQDISEELVYAPVEVVHADAAFAPLPDIHLSTVDLAGNVSASVSVRQAAGGCAQSRAGWAGLAALVLLAFRRRGRSGRS